MRGATEPPSRRFSIAQLALAVPWVALVIAAWGPMALADNSFLWHIRAGTLQADAGRVLTEDPFSFTMLGAEWRTQSWLIELFYAWAEGVAAGLGFVPAMILVVSTLTFLGIGLIAHRHSGSVTATAFVLLLSTLLMISFLVPRPVLFSYLLFVLVILAWDGRGSRWVIPLLFWMWAAVHGSFVIGLAYIGLRLVTRKDWRAVPTVAVAGLATLMTAHGLGVIEILYNFTQASSALAFISEWRKPSLLSPQFLPFLGGIVFIIVGASRRFVEPRHLWLLVPFLFLGFSSVRAIPPAWLGVLPLVALALTGLTVGLSRGLSPLPAGIFVIAVLVIPLIVRPSAELSNDRFPVSALSSLLDVGTFHSDRVGGFLIWAEGPDRLVYLDDRAELYLDRIEEFVQVRQGEMDWRPVFERDQIRQALLTTTEPLVDELKSDGWRTVYLDENWTILRP